MTSLTITALIDELAVTVYDNGLDSVEVNGLCNYVRNDANITSAEYESLNAEQKNLLRNTCQYVGPVETVS